MESTTEIFLRIAVSSDDDVIGGEGRVDKYTARIQVNGFSFKMSPKKETPRRDGQQETSENVEFQPVSVSRPFDTASNALGRMVKNRTPFSEARLTVDQHMTWGADQAREQNAIIVFHLLNGHVTSQTINAKEGDKGASMEETIQLTFKNVAIEYYMLNTEFRDGTMRNFREKAALAFESVNPDFKD